MIEIDSQLKAPDLKPALENVFELAGKKIRALDTRVKDSSGAPVFTQAGLYTSRGWTEWTQGFQYGMALLQFEATGDEQFLNLGRKRTLEEMASHVTHIGVHDHGFNNVSTYGTLLRLMAEGTIPANEWEKNFYELALKCTGAVQAARWTALPEGQGFVHSFNGPHSLFSDTIRSMRALVLADKLGHVLMGEQDKPYNLLDRALQHAEATARYNVYFGGKRDAYDLRGRVVHESIFNLNDGAYRCPSTQQGYSPFSTWTRGLSWILCGYPEELEYLDGLSEEAFLAHGGKEKVLARFIETARATADFYIEYTPTDGIPYWDTGAPGLAHMGDYMDRPSEPHNDYEPVDSSAAAISAQGLIRLGQWLKDHGQAADGERYLQAGLTVSRSVFADPYLSREDRHEGVILHSIYHRPNDWDYIPQGSKIPCGESSMWGDYHAMELAVMLWRMAAGKAYQRFFDIDVTS